ncbi:MAG: glycosyltransferase, partial [Anaerolineae bacterium]|nr:glycosyltransferase [Anaerolineae bacterium]
MMMLFACITVVLLGMLTIALLNTLTFPHLNPAPPHDLQSPLVSILIPARNEAAVIKKTVKNLLSQTYPHFELIILDDNSQDSTATVAQSAGQHDDRLRIIRGQPLPEGWLGKNWACQQLAQAAVGDWLIFTDADVTWQPAALAALMTEIDRTHADVITIWPTQHSQSWSERLVVPLMALAIVGYLPAVLVHRSPWPSFAAANGQCLAFRRSVYESIGGHTRVHSEVLEDVLLARHVKAGGFTLRMVDGNRLVTCRMYRNWTEVREGFAKNILSGYGNSVPLL